MDHGEMRQMGLDVLAALKREGTVPPAYDIVGIVPMDGLIWYTFRSPTSGGRVDQGIPTWIPQQTLEGDRNAAIAELRKLFLTAIGARDANVKAALEKEERERRLLEAPAPAVTDPTDQAQIERLVFYALRKMEGEGSLRSGWSIAKTTIGERIFVTIRRAAGGRQFLAVLRLRAEELTSGGAYMRVRAEIPAAIDRELQRGGVEPLGPDEEAGNE